MKTKTQLLVSSLTLIASILAPSASAQFFWNPGQGPGQNRPQVQSQPVQQIQQAPTIQSAPAPNSSTTVVTVFHPSGIGTLRTIGYSTAHPQDAVPNRSLIRSGNGEYYQNITQTYESTDRVVIQDPRTGRLTTELVQTRTVANSTAQAQTPLYYPTTTQVTYTPDAPKYKYVEGPAVAGKRGKK